MSSPRCEYCGEAVQFAGDHRVKLGGREMWRCDRGAAIRLQRLNPDERAKLLRESAGADQLPPRFTFARSFARSFGDL